MIHYSIISAERIFGVFSNMPLESVNDLGANNLELTEVEMEGFLVCGYPDGSDGIIIERIISTNPEVYLNEKFQPGQTLRK